MITAIVRQLESRDEADTSTQIISSLASVYRDFREAGNFTKVLDKLGGDEE
ncbi:MAG: hypothetical protein L3J32_11505 [Rhizobiaceae bacterium]|nr:hypothetical protein [Rhizobiaceae bacterium]